MAYSEKFQKIADEARARVDEVLPEQVDALLAQGAIALYIRDKEEYDADHIDGSVHISRGKLEMNVEAALPNLDTTILCYCNAFSRGALSAASLRSMATTTQNLLRAALKLTGLWENEGLQRTAKFFAVAPHDLSDCSQHSIVHAVDFPD